MTSRAPTFPERSGKEQKNQKPRGSSGSQDVPTLGRDLIQRAQLDPRSLTPNDVRAMHQTIGNRAVGRLMGGARSSPPAVTRGQAAIQCKLKVGAAGDKHEQEADRIAEEIAGPRKISAPRRVAPGNLVQRASGLGGGDVDLSIENRIHNVGGGASLPSSVRAAIEPRLGVDLGGVRTHTGKEAAEISSALGARAFTHKNHIYYGADQSPSDLGLTAHEVVHTIQQGATPSGGDVIQRDVGFEFESPTTRVHLPANYPDTPNKLYATKDTMAEIKKKYEVTSDSGNMEIVTHHFPETTQGRAQLDETMQSITSYCDGILSEGQVKEIDGSTKRVVTIEQLAGIAPVYKNHGDYQIAAPENGPIISHPQATAGIEMSKLFTLLEGLSNKKSDTFKVTGFDTRKNFSWQITHVKRGVDKAKSYVETLGNDKNYEKLKGLLAEIYGIILIGKAYFNKKTKYAKYLMPIMQRTDLASIFGLLGEHEQAVLTAKKDEILAHVGVASGDQLFPGGVEEWKDENKITVGDVYDGMTGGRDILAELSNAGSNMKDEDDIGPTETKRDRPGAIFELRRLKDKVEAKDWRAFALSIFDVITMLNQGKTFESEE